MYTTPSAIEALYINKINYNIGVVDEIELDKFEEEAKKYNLEEYETYNQIVEVQNGNHTYIINELENTNSPSDKLLSLIASANPIKCSTKLEYLKAPLLLF